MLLIVLCEAGAILCSATASYGMNLLAGRVEDQEAGLTKMVDRPWTARLKIT
jgi:hypothetical protein